jgi:hypothetical protein
MGDGGYVDAAAPFGRGPVPICLEQRRKGDGGMVVFVVS